ncbi:hypothetical protein HDU88_005400 [Geranomyces variabilis]|nr:hypothetical protein HDU88_005400 [Geranomyces variabilis]
MKEQRDAMDKELKPIRIRYVTFQPVPVPKLPHHPELAQLASGLEALCLADPVTSGFASLAGPNTPNLTSLPVEMIKHIILYVPFGDIRALRESCRRLFYLFDGEWLATLCLAAPSPRKALRHYAGTPVRWTRGFGPALFRIRMVQYKRLWLFDHPSVFRFLVSEVHGPMDARGIALVRMFLESFDRLRQANLLYLAVTMALEDAVYSGNEPLIRAIVEPVQLIASGFARRDWPSEHPTWSCPAIVAAIRMGRQDIAQLLVDASETTFCKSSNTHPLRKTQKFPRFRQNFIFTHWATYPPGGRFHSKENRSKFLQAVEGLRPLMEYRSQRHIHDTPYERLVHSFMPWREVVSKERFESTKLLVDKAVESHVDADLHCMQVAFAHSDRRMVKRALALGVVPDERCLRSAIVNNNIPLFMLALKRGVTPTVKDLESASYHAHYFIAECILEYGWWPSLFVRKCLWDTLWQYYYGPEMDDDGGPWWNTYKNRMETPQERLERLGLVKDGYSMGQVRFKDKEEIF